MQRCLFLCRFRRTLQYRELQRKLTLVQKSQPVPTKEQIDTAVAQAIARKEQAITEECRPLLLALKMARDELASIAGLTANDN